MANYTVPREELAHIRHPVGMDLPVFLAEPELWAEIFPDLVSIQDLTIRENVYLPLRIAKSKNAEQRVKGLLKTFGIDALSRKRPNEISGGESQKAAICRALANNPSVMLADEPTASLDSESCGIVLDAFKMIRENFDTTIVVASHDPLLYDHIEKKYFLFDGRLKTEPKEV